MTYSANIHLQESSNDRFQLIYASQLYGTFFTIYGKFTVQSGKLSHIDLHLINLKGLLNLGMTHAELTPGFAKDEVLDFGNDGRSKVLSCLTLKVDVKALATNNPKSVPCNIPLPDKGSEHYFRVERSLKPIDEAEEHGVFDEEFYYREGLKPKEEIDRSMRDGFEDKSTISDDSQGEDSEAPKDPGGLCPRGYSLIIT